MLLKSAARTPKRRDPELSRERVLQAGIRVFSERGPDAATVARISREAGLNRRMVYHYFDSKEGLYRAILKAAEASEAFRMERKALAQSLLP